MVESVVEVRRVEVCLLFCLLDSACRSVDVAYLDGERKQVVPTPSWVSEFHPPVKDSSAASAVVYAIGCGTATQPASPWTRLASDSRRQGGHAMVVQDAVVEIFLWQCVIVPINRCA